MRAPRGVAADALNSEFWLGMSRKRMDSNFGAAATQISGFAGRGPPSRLDLHCQALAVNSFSSPASDVFRRRNERTGASGDCAGDHMRDCVRLGSSCTTTTTTTTAAATATATAPDLSDKTTTNQKINLENAAATSTD